MIIIGILAAIAIPVFLSQRNKAWDASAESDARNGASLATSYASYHNGSVSGMNATALEAAPYNWRISPGNTNEAATPAADNVNYTISVESQSGKTATFDSTTGSVTTA